MITHVGYGHRDLSTDPPVYERRHAELLVLLEGQCGVITQNQPIAMNPASAWLMPAHSRHAWLGDGHSCRLLSVMLPSYGAALDERLRHSGCLYTTTDASIRAHFDQLGNRLAAHRNNYWTLCHLANVVIGEVGLLFQQTGSQAAPADWRVDHALNWFDQHMHEGPSCDDIADAVHCSPAHLRRLFKDAGLAPIMARLDERRLARATAMLSERQWNTDYIAKQCGWRSAGALTHAMRRHYGCSVREWLRAHT